MHRTRRRAALAVAALLLCGHSAPARAAAAPAAPCTEFAASPAFARDGIALCAGLRYDRTTGNLTDIAVFVTRNAGRSWSQATGRLTHPALGYLMDVFFSPRFSEDGMVFVLSSEGLHMTTDLGATFTVVQPGALARPQPFVAVTDGAPRTLVALPEWTPQQAHGLVTILDPASGRRTLVEGSPGHDREIVFSPSFAADGIAYAMSDDPAREGFQYSLYRCDAALTCSTRLQTFPAGWTFDRIWLAPDFPSSRTFYVTLSSPSGRVGHWWSRDGGRTMTRWASVERLQPDYAKVATGLAGVAGTRTLYLRISGSGSTSPGAAPYERLYRSDDRGASWRLVSYGRTPAQPGPRGTMPPNTPRTHSWLGETARGVLTAAGGRIFSLGRTYESDVVDSFFCSADGGRTWRRTC